MPLQYNNQEMDFARIYETVYQQGLAQGDDRRVARAMAKSAETAARREAKHQQTIAARQKFFQRELTVANSGTKML